MAIVCSVDGCVNTARNMPCLSYFRIPKDIEKMKIWVELIGREDILTKENPHSYKVCEIHFDPIMITKGKHLVSTAVPSRNLPFNSVQDITELAQSGEALNMADEALIMNQQLDQPMVIIDGQPMIPNQPMLLHPQPMMHHQPMMIQDEEMMDSQPIFIDMGPAPEQYNFTEEFHSEDYDNRIETSGDDIIAESIRKAMEFDPEREPTPSSSKVQELQHIIKINEEPNEYVAVRTKRVKCPECSYYSAENEEQMTRHIKKMHRGENPFKCFMCDYSTYNKTIFEEHVRVHQGLKPYKCSVCPHRSVAKKNLRRHEKIHRPDNPLKCKKCSFIARHHRALSFHLAKCNLEEKKEEAPKESPKRKKAKVEKIFKCKHCGWASSHKPKILLHLIHHPKQKVDSRIDLSILKKYHIID